MGDSSRVIEENALMLKLSARGPRACAACTKPCVLTRLRARLQPLSLEVRDIKADGHCLYRSLEDQLALEQGAWHGS